MEATSTGTADSSDENLYIRALLGAVVTVLTAFVPFSPILGGGVAGYLHHDGASSGTRVGAIAGLLAALPLALVFFLLFGIMSIGSITTGEFAGPTFVVLLIGAILLFAAAYIVGLSALGGYVGDQLAAGRADRPETGRQEREHTLDEYADDQDTPTDSPPSD